MPFPSLAFTRDYAVSWQVGFSYHFSPLVELAFTLSSSCCTPDVNNIPFTYDMYVCLLHFFPISYFYLDMCVGCMGQGIVVCHAVKTASGRISL